MLTPEPADKVKGAQGPAGEPRVAARATEAAAPVRLLPTAELSSRQRSEQMDAVVEQVVRLNQQVDKLTACAAAASRDIRGLIARVNELEKSAWALPDSASLQGIAERDRWRPVTFGQRVRWLVLGR